MLRDWVHRFNQCGPDGLTDAWSSGNPPRLVVSQTGARSNLTTETPAAQTHQTITGLNGIAYLGGVRNPFRVREKG